jgi:hypothetical protein
MANCSKHYPRDTKTSVVQCSTNAQIHCEIAQRFRPALRKNAITLRNCGIAAGGFFPWGKEGFVMTELENATLGVPSQ